VDPEVDIAPYGTESDSESDSDATTAKPKETQKKPKKKKSKLYREDDTTTQSKTKTPTGTRYAFGLDSGCGHGKQLTALIVEAGPGGITHRVEQVDCSASIREAEEETQGAAQQVLVGS
ncbi:hypothetical protein C8A05DRAFT_30444, partial [Staphylotrichum tortipilum]